MKKLIVMPEGPDAVEIQRRLEEASCESTLTYEHPPWGPYMGGARQAIIWLLHAEQLATAEQVIERFFTEARHRALEKCPHCGYDLRGHTHDAPFRCPECGRTLRAGYSRPAEEVECPACSAPVPAHFEICWSCGGKLGAEAHARHDDA